MEKEVRFLNIEYRLNENREVEGRAIPFNIKSPNREGFREEVSPESVEGVFEKSDVFMLYNHDKSKGFLARCNKGKGTLKIDVREDGVYFSFPAKRDNLSNYIYERLESGEIDETSWAFTIEKDTWVKGADGVWDRTINKFDQIYDLSIVDQSYYGLENVVGCKRYAEILEEEKAENEKKLAELEAREAEEEVEAEKPEEEPQEAPEEENRSEKEPEISTEEPSKNLEDYYNQVRKDNEQYLKKE